MEIRRLETADGKLVAPRVSLARSLGRRTLGLMFRKALPEGDGLALHPCNQIHMFFMRIPLDVAFVDDKGKVLHAVHGIKPWRATKMVWGSKSAIELPAGTLEAAGVGRGSFLRLVEVPGGP